MHPSLLFALYLAALVTAAPNSFKEPSSKDKRLKVQSQKGLEEEWKAFKINYNKTYRDANEEIFRKKIFAGHLEAIEAHKRVYAKGLKTFTMKINRFSDLEKSEVVRRMTGYKPRNKFEVSTPSIFYAPKVETKSVSTQEDSRHCRHDYYYHYYCYYYYYYNYDYYYKYCCKIPDEVDWRPKGYVTPVKNQEPCGSCWAFSATGALEGQHFRKTGKLVSLSEQQLVDCSTRNYGCDGGWPHEALRYIASNKGINTEESYPYEGVDGPCRYSLSTIGATCNKYVDIPQSESALKEAVAKIGPISVAIDASHSSFHHYSCGIYDEPGCSRSQPNHAVLVVGYGTDSGVDYWIIKNSWGTDWGMDGYIRMSRNKDNQCGIATDATYPEV